MALRLFVGFRFGGLLGLGSFLRLGKIFATGDRLDLADVQSFLNDALRDFFGILNLVAAEGAGGTARNLSFLYPQKYDFRELEKTETVGNRGTGLAHNFRQIFMRVTVIVN